METIFVKDLKQDIFVIFRVKNEEAVEQLARDLSGELPFRSIILSENQDITLIVQEKE
jgi:6-phosphogluconolactonase (cycloisomerase 2 family)